ncbi:MAG: phosphoribosyl-AMP cyclohydrolase [Candidatus Omnitrophica bacterium]|nr:phosphoribosyl-AMP cyclohydrolase [Candidatus Omnitrophota bacterium]
MADIIRKIKFNSAGLVPAIVQDSQTREVLMMAYMNAEAIEKTLATGKMHFYSRSRKTLWLKGETSSHIQEVRAVFLDCDSDTLLFQVSQRGGACHEGYRTCFFKQLNSDKGDFTIVGEKVFDPEKIYRKK